MMADQNLFLYEEVLLLALRDEAGTLAVETVDYTLAGAVLAELLLAGRISVDDSRRKLVNMHDLSPMNDPVMDESLERLANAKRRASMQTWVSRLAGIKHFRHKAATHLCERDILKSEEDKVFFFFTRKIYPEINPVPEDKIIERLRHAIFSDDKDIDPRTMVLISLADSAGLLKENLDRRELKSRKARIKQIINGEVTGKVTRDAIQAMQAAVMVACIMPAITATTVVST